MSWNDSQTDLEIYQDWVKSQTSKHVTETDTSYLVWSVLGLVAETGEVVELLEKAMRKDITLDLDSLSEELGDVLWYVASVCNAANLDMDDLINQNISKINKRSAESGPAEVR